MSKYKVVPISPSRNIEDAIGRARNLSASEIWEDALVAASETGMVAITTAEYVLSSAMANRVAELENVLRKASAHVQPTCFELYDELIKTLENKRPPVEQQPVPDVAALVEALESIMGYIPLDVVHCRGDKCRELWCASCFGDEEAESYLVTAARHLKNAKSALAAHHNQQEKSHDNN